MAEEITRLPERERRILELYYHEGLTMRETGEVLGITESRVCQLHSQAASRLRVGLAARLHVTGTARYVDDIPLVPLIPGASDKITLFIDCIGRRITEIRNKANP